MAKFELYASKGAMKKHEKGEGKAMNAFEKKQGIKNVVKKSSAKKSMVKKMGKKK
jgi:hypothetical protein